MLAKNNTVRVLMFIITCICLFSNQKIHAQSFSHSLGAGILAGEEGMGLGLVYSPRVNLVKVGEDMTASLGSHIGVIANTDTDNSGSTTQSMIGFELPIMFELNFGASSHPDNTSSFGGFIGVGYGISSISQADPGESIAKGIIYDAGLRFSGEWGIKFAYLENFNDNIFGGASITIQWNIN